MDLLEPDGEHGRGSPGGLLDIERGKGGDSVGQAHGGGGRVAGLGRRWRGGLGRGGCRCRREPAGLTVGDDHRLGAERPGTPLDGFQPEYFTELRLVVGQGNDDGRGVVRLARRRVEGGRDLPAGQLRPLGVKGPRGGCGVQRGARREVVYPLAELQRGTVAGDPLGLDK